MTPTRWQLAAWRRMKEAWKRGYLAGRKGKPKTACPYGEGPGAGAYRSEWMKGWLDAIQSGEG